MPLIYNENTGEFAERRYDHLPKIENVRVSPSDIVCVGEKIYVSADLEDTEDLLFDDVSIPMSFPIEIPCPTQGIQRHIIVAKNDFGSQEIKINYKVYPKPVIELVSSPAKLHKGRHESVNLVWKVQNSKKITLLQDGQVIKENCQPDDRYKFHTNEDTTFVLCVVALDGKTIEEKSIDIRVFPDAIFTFETDKEYVFPTIPFTLSWRTKNAKKVMLNGKEVEPEGTLLMKDGVDKETPYILGVTDEFGTKEQTIRVKILPIPRIETLLVPSPNLEKNVDIQFSLEVPQFVVDIPNFYIEEIEIVPPEVYELGVDTSAAQSPPRIKLLELGTPNLWSMIETFFVRLNNKIHHYDK